MKKNNTPSLNSHLTRKSLYVAMATISHLMLSATPALAGPVGGKVVGGGGSIDQSGLSTTIRQQTDRIAIDWQSFNVAADEKVKFIQPGSSSVALNRVLSHTGSEIHGQIEANGHIFLVNPNGVLFGENSRINVGGMIASGLHIDPNDFMNGDFTLTAIEGAEGKVINSGIINAATGGSVTLVGQQVENGGLISAKLGAVNLAAGKEAVITFDASGLVGVRVTEEVLQNELGIDAAVMNSGEINAEGGRILLSASTSQDIFSQAVNHGNLNSATSVAVHEDGSFTLGAGADVVNSGNLSVSNTSGGAGQIVLIGENITTSGKINADASGNGDNRNGGFVTLTANGDIEVTSISTVGADGVNSSGSRAGGAGGSVSLVSAAGSIEVGLINTSGGDGRTSGSGSRNGGNAGDIIITTQAAEQSIVLKRDLTAQGGKRGDSDDQNGAGGNIDINGAVQLAVNINIDAGVKSDASGKESRGNIIFNGSVDSNSDTAAHNLTLTAKDVIFSEDVGSIYRLGNLNINAVGDVVARSEGAEPSYRNISARSLNETAIGDVATSFHVGNITTAATATDTAGGNITIAANNIRVGTVNSSGLGTENGGGIAISASGNNAKIVLAGDINSQSGDKTAQGNVDVKLLSAGSVSLSHTDFFKSVVDVIGSSGVDTLNGFNIDSTWSIDKKNGGNINNNVVFDRIERLKGGDSKNKFSFSGSNNTGSISHIEGGGGDNTLIGRDAKNTWEIGETNSLLADNNSPYVTTFENINILQGGGDADTFNIRAAFNGNLLGGNGNDEFLFFSSGKAASVDGQGGSDTLIGRHDKRNTWRVSADSRSVKETGASSNYVESFAGIEILQGGDAVDTFDITADFTGSLYGGGSADVFNLGASVTNVYGNAGNDKFTIIAAGVNASLDGGGDDGDSLTTNVDSDTNVWTINGVDKGNLVNVGTINFQGMNTLNGGSGIDAFVLNDEASFDGTINGGSGTGINQLTNNNSNITWTLTGSYQGNLENGSFNTIASFRNIQTIIGSGSDTLIGRDQANDWHITGDNSGHVQILNGSVDRIDFSGMNNLTGRAKTDRFTFKDLGVISGVVNGGDGNGVDTLVGRNTDNAWLIDGSDQGDISDINTNASPYVKFFNIENISGGTGADTFFFTSSGDITGVINGGNHGELEAVDTLNLASLVGEVHVELFESGTPHLHVLNMEKIIAPSASPTSNFLYGASDQPYTWTIDGSNSGTLAAFENPSFELRVKFSNFGQLRGGTNDDRFEVIKTGIINGTIHGGDGIGKDFADYSGAEAHVTIALGGDGSLGVTGIDGIEGIVGNNDGTSSNPYYSSISIDGGNNIWTIGNPSTDGINDGQIAINGSSTKVISFENFNILNGGSGDDRFSLSANGGKLIGYINGGDGKNSFNATASSIDQTVYINSNALDFDNVVYVAGATHLFGFDKIIANAGTDSTLISNQDANTWNIQLGGTNLLNVDGKNINFDGFSRLVGGAEADLFYIHGLDNIPAVVDGGKGTAKDHVYFTPLNPAIGVTVGVGDVSVTTDLNIFNIEYLAGHDNDKNTLISNGSSDSWVINGSNQGILNSSLEFNGFSNLTGGDGNDKFNIVGENAALSGTLDGGTGNDSLSFSGRAAVLELFVAALPDDRFNAINFETINADTDVNFSNTLIAGDTKNDWIIDSLNTGTLNNGILKTAFKGFENLIGGGGIDGFVFEGSGKLDGYIDGGSQPANGFDTVDLSELSNADVSLGNTTNRDIEKIIGNGTSVLTNTDVGDWTLLGHNSGSVNNILFAGFATLVGGDGNDTFNLTQGSLSGSVYGGKGDDTFTISGATIDGSVFGDAGNDHFIAIITPGSRGRVRFEGGDGNNSLEASGGNAEYNVQHDASNGEFSYTDKQNNKYDLSFTGITNITDNVTANLLEITTTSAADTITLKKDAYSLNAIDVNYTNKENLSIAASAADEVVISGAVKVPELLTIRGARVSAADTSSVITAKGLLLDGTAQVGSSTNRVKVNIDNLYARYANGAIYLQEQRGLNIGEFSSSSLLDIRLEGDLTSSVALSSSQDVSIATSNGNIVLDKENALSGGLNLAASNSINLRNLTTTNLKNVKARNLTVNSTGVINGGGVIQVDGLASLVSGGNINLANQNHDFNFVQIGSAANVSINNIDSLRLTGVNASGALNINAQGIDVDGPIDTASVMLNAGQGDAVLSGNVAVDGKANVVGRNITVDGDLLAANIQLDGSQGQVLINGRLNTVGKESITVAANQVVQNGLMSAGTGVTMQASDSITQNAGITAATDVLLTAGGDLFMNGRHTTQGQQVNYSAGGNMGLADINATKGIKISAAGSVNQRGNITSSVGDIVIDSGRYSMEAGSALTANAGSVLLASTADITTRKISAATEVSLAASGNAQILDEVTTEGAVSIQGGSVTLASNLIGNTGIDVASANGNIQQEAQLNSAQGDIRVAAGGDIAMGAGSSTLSTNGNINYSGANLGITSLDALKTVTLAATRGAVTDVNGNDNNITAQRLVIDAATGIGSNDIIETLVEQLSVSNNVGDIRLQNNKAVTVDRLRSNGNIVFNNLIGNVTLDNSQGTLFSRTETDARLAGGTMNANYDIGTLTINVAAGDLTATGVADLKNPDIVARNAALIAPIGNIGTFARPLVIYVKDSLFIAGFNSWNPFWAFGVSPATVDNASTIQGDLSDLLASGNETLVVVEALNEVDPAIFTSVRNYSYDDISILLPKDQLYYGD